MGTYDSDNEKYSPKRPWSSALRSILGRRAMPEERSIYDERHEKLISDFDICREGSTSALRGRLIEVSSQDLTEMDLMPAIGDIRVLSWLNAGMNNGLGSYAATSMVFDPARRDDQDGAVSRGLCHDVLYGRYRDPDGSLTSSMEYVGSMPIQEYYSEFFSRRNELPKVVQLATLSRYQLDEPYSFDESGPIVDAEAARASERFNQILACVAEGYSRHQ